MSLQEQAPAYDPYAPYGPQNLPPREEQTRFFEYAIHAGQAAGVDRRVLIGPHRPRFSRATHITDEELRDINPGITAEYLYGQGYRSPRTIDGLKSLDGAVRGIHGVITRHRRRLRELGERLHDNTGLSEQTIASSVLARPPQLYAGLEEGHYALDGTRMCFNACFRMVFTAIAGWEPSEVASSQAMRRFNHGSAISHQRHYWDILRSPAFSSHIRVAAFTGADLAFIGGFAARLHAKQPHAKLYTLVNTDSLAAYRPNAWHTFILNHADDQRVYVQDPRAPQHGNVLTVGKRAFAGAWGVGLNSGYFVIDTAPRP